MEAHNTQHTKNTDPGVNPGVNPEVSQAVDLARNYSKISVEDMCYFLNDRVDLARNESYFDGYDPDEFSGSEMYEFLKFKTDNFDIIKFQLVIDEIRLFTPLFYKIVDDDIINEESYNSEWNTDDKLHDYIERTLELNDGLFLHCEQIKQFSLLAEELYQSINDTSAPDTATIEPPPPEMNLSKLDDLFILKITEKQKARLKADIETFISTYKKKQIVALASILYDLLHVNIKRDHSFKSWLKMFCEIVGKEIPTAKENQVKEEIKAMKNTYYYLFPD